MRRKKVIHLLICLLSAIILCLGIDNKVYGKTGRSSEPSIETIEDLVTSAVKEYRPELHRMRDIQDTMKVKASNIDYVYDVDTRRVVLFNNKYYDVIFGERQYSTDELIEIIDNNEGIGDKYKDITKDFVKKMLEYYDGVETRALAENLKGLRIIENVTMDKGITDLAYFDPYDKTIDIKGELDLDNKVLDRIIMRHELGHMFDNVSVKYKDFAIRYTFYYHLHGKYTGEALNVIFTTRPFIDEYEPHGVENYGYKLLAEKMEVIVNALQSYDYQDYVTGNIYNLETIMNNQFYMKGLADYKANYFVDIMELQWLVHVGDDVKLEEVYYEDLDYFLNTIKENQK